MSNWGRVRLGDVATVVSGSTPKTSVKEYWNGDYDWVTPIEINDDTFIINETQRKITKLAVDDTSLRLLPRGTVLLSSRAPIGKVAITGKAMYCNQGFKNLICHNKIYNKYLFWYLKNKTHYLNSLGRGATFKEISKSIVENVELPLPPLDVQQNIAKTLDAVSDLITLRKQQLTELDKLIQSSFHEMFGNPVTNEKGWDMSPLDTFGILKNGMNFSSRDSGVSIHCLGVGDFQNNYRIENTDRLPKISLNKMPAVDYLLQDRDIVFVRSNGNKALVGRCVLVYPGNIPTTFSGFCIRFRPTTKELVETYLIQVLHNTSLKEQLFSNGRGANITNLNQQMLSSMKIPLPPVNLQNQFAEIVTKIEEQKVLVQAAIDESQTLFDSLMSRYFE